MYYESKIKYEYHCFTLIIYSIHAACISQLYVHQVQETLTYLAAYFQSIFEYS